MSAALHSERADLFRLLGDEDRLRLFALCAEEALTVSELAELLGESQPQTSRKAQPLRAAGLLVARKDGTRTYLKASTDVAAVMGDSDAAIVAVALEEGRRLCTQDKSLARLPRVLLAREEGSRRFFDDDAAVDVVAVPSSLAFLPLLKPLLGARAEGLCVDVGAGDGLLLPLLSPLFSRVFAVDRSAARLAGCARVVAAADLANVRLLEGDAAEPAIYEAVFHAGGAAVVVVARTLHHAAKPADLLASCARLLRDDGIVVVVDYLPHDDEAMRARGDVWLGFTPSQLATHLRDAGLVVVANAPMAAVPGHDDSHLAWQWSAAVRPPPSSSSSSLQ
ncbi:MAG TPA: methyltransferase domain-containing protein [Myxococcota bacterium]